MLFSRGLFFFAQQTLPLLLASVEISRCPPSLLITGATASIKGSANFASFATGKSASRALGQCLAREFGPRGIHVAHCRGSRVSRSASCTRRSRRKQNERAGARERVQSPIKGVKRSCMSVCAVGTLYVLVCVEYHVVPPQHVIVDGMSDIPMTDAWVANNVVEDGKISPDAVS